MVLFAVALTTCSRMQMMAVPTIRQFLEYTMLNQSENECLIECNACAAACLQCASDCIDEEDPKSMARCIKLDLECADICRLAAASIARGDDNMKAVCSLCADACETCGTECAKHPMDHCKRCAEACKRCAAACRNMA
ncbi:MAG: four-helix bundle copper-binding protein [Thiobacillus sp.]